MKKNIFFGSRIIQSINFKAIYNKAVINGFPLILRDFLLITINFIQIYFFTNFATKDLYGKFQYTLSIVGILAFLSLPGMNVAVTKMAAIKEEEYYTKIVKNRIKVSLLATITLVCISIYYFLSIKKDLFYAFLVSALLYPGNFALDSYISFFNGKEKYVTIAKYQIYKRIINVGAIVNSIFFFNNAAYIIAASFICNNIFNIIANIIVISNINRKNIDSKKLKEYKKYGYNLSLIGILGNIQTRIDKIIVGIFFGFEELAIFHVGKIFQEKLKMIWVIIYQLVFPCFFKKDLRENKLFLKKICTLTIIFFSILIVGLYLALPYIVLYIFSQKYKDSILFGRLFICAFLIGLPGAIYESFLKAENRITHLLFLRILTSITYFISLPILIVLFNIKGIIYSIYVKNLIYSIFSVLFVNKIN